MINIQKALGQREGERYLDAFDLFIAGGGVTGAGIGIDATRRGL